MKKVFLISSFLVMTIAGIVWTGVAYAQQYPVSAFYIYGVADPSNPAHDIQLQTTLPLMQDAGFNWGLAFIGSSGSGTVPISDAQINSLLNAASAHSVKLILNTLLEGYAQVERFYLAPNLNYFSTVNGNHPVTYDANSDQPEGDPYYDRIALQATITSDYMVKDVVNTPIDPWWHSGPTISYQAHFRLKIQRTGNPSASTPIVDIEVYDQHAQSMIISRTLLLSDFPNDNTYYADGRFALPFTPNTYTYGATQSSSASSTASAGDGIPPSRTVASTNYAIAPVDIRVKYRAEAAAAGIQLWLDNIRVDSPYQYGPDPSQLFGGYHDNTIKTTVQKFNANSGLGRFWLRDEPYVTQYLAAAYVSNLLKVASPDPGSGQGLGYTQKDEGNHGDMVNGDPYVRYVQEVTPFELVAEVNRFAYSGEPLPSNPPNPDYTSFCQNTAFQSETSKFKLAQQNSAYTPSKTWRYHLNSSQWRGSTREPHLNEIFAQTHLALAYGAKGIDYFTYLSGSNFDLVGLVEPGTLRPINGSSSYAVYHDEDKWNGIKALNRKLAGPFGTTLMNLTWQKGFGIHLLNGGSTGTYLSTVTTQDPSDQRYVELGEFKDGSSRDYFLIVNRRTQSGESRNITMNLSLPPGTWDISDVSSGNTWIIPSNGSFTDSFTPGEGKLYAVIPANYGGTKTVPSGATMTVSPGATLRFASTNIRLAVNGALNAAGTAANPITIDFTAPYVYGMNGIQLGSGSSGSFSYCNIKNASYGVYATNASYLGINHCTITGCGQAGVYSSGRLPGITNSTFTGNGTAINISNTGLVASPFIAFNTISSNSYGIYLYNSSPMYLEYNTISNNGGDAIYCMHYSQPYMRSNTIYGNARDGIHAEDGSPAHCGSYYGDPGLNVIRQNGRYGVYGSYSNVYLGSTDTHYGMNSIYSNSSYEVWAGHSTILAQYNWWNVPYFPYFPSGDLHSENGGSINPYPGLSWDPNSGRQTAPGSVSPTYAAQRAVAPATSTAPSAVTAVDTTFFDSELAAAVAKLSEGKHKEAVPLFEQKFKNEKNTTKKRYVLEQLAECYRGLDSTSTGKAISAEAFIRFLKKEVRPNLAQTDQLYAMTLDLESAFLLDEGQLEKAADILITLKDNFTDADIQKRAMFNLAFIYQNLLGNSQEGQKYFAQLKRDYPNDELTGLGERVLVGFGDGAEGSVAAKGLQAGVADSAEGNAVLGNYPNPFNPSTAISYKLSAVGHVTLRIYDILGREVATLVNGIQSAGMHTTQFNGERLASGVYFYRLTAPGVNQVRKMLLTK